MFTNEAAFEFAAKWLVYPKMYIGLILPNKYSIDIRDAVKSTRKIIANGDGRNVYFMATSNVTKYETFPHIQNELIWYPFEIGIYGTDCLSFIFEYLAVSDLSPVLAGVITDNEFWQLESCLHTSADFSVLRLIGQTCQSYQSTGGLLVEGDLRT